MKNAVFARTLLMTSALFTTLSQAHAADDKSPADANAIIVTGSAIRTSPDAVAVPVSIIGADDIAKSGVQSNVLDILRKALPSFGGRSNQGASNGANNNGNYILYSLDALG
jgi:iron complex outermembrane receptor protein